MKKLISAVLSGVVLLSLTTAVNASNQKIFYVSVSGTENADGSKENPFTSIEEARDAIRELKKNNQYPDGGVTVYLREGKYSVSKAIEFGKEDSGLEGAPVTYRAYPMENVEIMGGTEITLGDCQRLDTVTFNSVLNGKIYKYNLKDNNVEGYDKLYCTGHSQYYMSIAYPDECPSNALIVPEVFYNDNATSIARYPNGNEYARIASVVQEGDVIHNKTKETAIPLEQVETMIFKTDLPKEQLENWADEEDAWLFGYWRYDWSDQTTPIRKIDPDAGTIETSLPSAFGAIEGQRFYIYNALCELDEPGEWYYDRESGDFYIYPLDGDRNSKILLGFASNNLMEISECDNLIVKDIDFKGTRAGGIIISQCKNVTIFGCNIKNVSGTGIVMNGVDGKNNTIDSCHISNVGGRGIYMDCGNFTTLEPANCIVTNNWVHDFGRLNKSYYGALTINGVGNIARNNLFYNGPHLGIQYGGNDNLIEYNDISRCLKEAADMGVCYTGRTMMERGTVLRGNIIHDIESDSEHDGQYAIYMDDCKAGDTVTQNLIYNMCDTGIFINGGRDITVTDNVFVNMKRTTLYAATGLAKSWGYNESWLGDTYKIVPGGMHTTEPYKKYPHLSDLLEDDNPMAPKYCIIKDNINCNTEKGIVVDDHSMEGSGINEKKMREWSEVKDDVTVGADFFVDAASENYNIKGDITSKLPDFETIDFNKAGLITSRLKNELSKDAVCLAVNKPVSYVNWQKKMIDSSNIDVVPEIHNNLTYVPVRFLAEMLGAEVSYEDGKAIIKYNGKTLEITKGSAQANVDGEATELAGAALNQNSRMYIPLRSCSELFEKKVFWNDCGLIIISDREMDDIMDEDMITNLYNRM